MEYYSGGVQTTGTTGNLCSVAVPADIGIHVVRDEHRDIETAETNKNRLVQSLQFLLSREVRDVVPGLNVLSRLLGVKHALRVDHERTLVLVLQLLALGCFQRSKNLVKRSLQFLDDVLLDDLERPLGQAEADERVVGHGVFRVDVVDEVSTLDERSAERICSHKALTS